MKHSPALLHSRRPSSRRLPGGSPRSARPSKLRFVAGAPALLACSWLVAGCSSTGAAVGTDMTRVQPEGAAPGPGNGNSGGVAGPGGNGGPGSVSGGGTPEGNPTPVGTVNPGQPAPTGGEDAPVEVPKECVPGPIVGGSGQSGPPLEFEAVAGPPLRVDLDIPGRPTAEVTEIGYESWPVESGVTIQRTFGNVTLRFDKLGAVGTQLEGEWARGIIQQPAYSRLAGDGLTVEDGDAGAEIQLTIDGLAPGRHTLLLFVNDVANPANNTFAPVDILLNGAPAVTGFVPAVRALSSYDATTAFLSFEATAGQSTVVTLRADVTSTASRKNIVINGLELDTPNAAAQAKRPGPAHANEHVDADTGKVTLTWDAGDGALTHDVYVGESPEEVAAADRSSPTFRGNQAGTSLEIGCLSSRKTYYWRIDEVDGSGAGTPGDLWSFRPRHLAFAGAQGYGRFARGGRDGVVVHVTNLDDAGPGSLREAIENDVGPRTIVFDVGGVITLASRLVLNDSYVTVAGQTAPGKGIVIRSAPFGLSGAVDAIVRHVRVRVGAGTTYDGMGMAGTDHSIIDHASISWTIDEAFSSRNGKNITLQRTLISEALNIAGHANYPAGEAHGYAATIGGDTGSYHHNLLAHCEGRNWSLGGGLDGFGAAAGRIDIFNNVVYNWGGRNTDGGAREVNFVGNYYKPGPASRIFVALRAQYEGANPQQYFVAGNVMPGYFDEATQDAGRTFTGTPVGDYSPFVESAFFPSFARVESAELAYKSVLSDVGASSPVLDDHDRRVIRETRDGTTTYVGSVSGTPGLPDHQDDVGGYELYPSEQRDAAWDTDGDGLPNWWETARGLNVASAPGDFSDTNTDADGDEFVELEDYLGWLSNPHYLTAQGSDVTISLEELFAGYVQGPSYSLSGTDAGAVNLEGSSAVFSAGRCGFSSFVLAVRDAAGAEMSQPVGVFVDCGG